MANNSETILISVPYFRCKETLDRAVQSILQQTHRDFILVIGNDGDIPPDISKYRDSRVLLYNFPDNNGRYFVDCCMLEASPFKYYSVHDADDYSVPQRLEKLFRMLKNHNCSAVVSQQLVIGLSNNRQIEHNESLNLPLNKDKMQWLGHHAGIYTKECLQMIGGFNPEFRVGYDTLMTNLIRILDHKIECYPQPLYHRIARANSLVRSKETGFGSQHRRSASMKLDEMYLKCLEYVHPKEIQNIVSTKNNQIRDKVKFHVEQIKKQFQW